MKNDEKTIHPNDVVQAMVLLTRVPMPTLTQDRGARAAWAYPIAGLVIGSIAAAVALGASAIGLPAPLCALAALTSLVLTTGAMHEDGLADTADGLWGGWTPERRLEIMKDSRIGAYGVIALILGMSARWAALWILFEVSISVAVISLIAAPVLSRATMPAVMHLLPHARADGLSHHVGQVKRSTALIAAVLGVCAILILLGPAGILVALTGFAAAALIGWRAKAKIGGQTGDILGATQQISEISVLFCLVALQS